MIRDKLITKCQVKHNENKARRMCGEAVLRGNVVNVKHMNVIQPHSIRNCTMETPWYRDTVSPERMALLMFRIITLNVLSIALLWKKIWVELESNRPSSALA